MFGPADAEDVYSVIEKLSRVLNVPCSRDKVWPILTALEPLEGAVIFSASSGDRFGGDLDLSVQVPGGVGDPYAYALSKGFVPETDHPVGVMLSDVAERFTVDEYAADFGVVSGFNKIYAHSPHNNQPVSKLATIPSMPRALAENLDFFTRNGLDEVEIIAADYQRKTMNVYFSIHSGFERKTILSMLREVGVSEPDEQLLDFACRTFRVYFTFGWDSPKILRIAFPGSLDLSVMHGRVEPEIERFITSVPQTYPGDPFSMSIVKWSSDEEWFNVGSYYQFGPLQWEVVKEKILKS